MIISIAAMFESGMTAASDEAGNLTVTATDDGLDNHVSTNLKDIIYYRIS